LFAIVVFEELGQFGSVGYPEAAIDVSQMGVHRTFAQEQRRGGLRDMLADETERI